MHPATSKIALSQPHEFQLNADATVRVVPVAAAAGDSGGCADHTAVNKRLRAVT